MFHIPDPETVLPPQYAGLAMAMQEVKAFSPQRTLEEQRLALEVFEGVLDVIRAVRTRGDLDLAHELILGATGVVRDLARLFGEGPELFFE